HAYRAGVGVAPDKGRERGAGGAAAASALNALGVEASPISWLWRNSSTLVVSRSASTSARNPILVHCSTRGSCGTELCRTSRRFWRSRLVRSSITASRLSIIAVELPGG